MRKISQYIFEKLRINKNTNAKFNPDEFNNKEEVLYSDDYNSDDYEGSNVFRHWNEAWEDFLEILIDINNSYQGFLYTKYYSLSQADNKNPLEKIIKDYNTDIKDIIKTIISGKDAGYEVRLHHGHLEIDCINSGSRCTYYIYALSNDGVDMVESYYDGYIEDNISILINEKFIIELDI